MAGQSSIGWTEATWNPVVGCTAVSPGCTNCYAMEQAARQRRLGTERYHGVTRVSGGRAKWTGKVVVAEEVMQDPLHWREPRMIFVNSMSDLFHESLPEEAIRRVWRVMQEAHWHTYQILTKRPERMREFVFSGAVSVLPQVWLGTSVESQDFVGRIDVLREVPAAVRFVSFEPLLGPVEDVGLAGIRWAILGGESGKGHRPCKPEWLRSLRDQCLAQGVRLFLKQHGAYENNPLVVEQGMSLQEARALDPDPKKGGSMLDGRRWRQYPPRYG
jgi:protein gp37